MIDLVVLAAKWVAAWGAVFLVAGVVYFATGDGVVARSGGFDRYEDAAVVLTFLGLAMLSTGTALWVAADARIRIPTSPPDPGVDDYR